MKKKTHRVALFIFMVALFHTSSSAYTTVRTSLGENPEWVSMTFSDTKVPFENAPMVIDGEIMIPAETFFDYIKAQIYKMPLENQFVAYKDNTFIKFREGHGFAYLNGSKKKLNVAPYLFQDTLYIPFDLVAQSFNINYEYLPKNFSLLAAYRDAAPQYKVEGENTYKSITLNTLGISFFIPTSWSKLEGANHRYGLKNVYEDFYIDFTPVQLNKDYTRKRLFEDLKNALLKSSPNSEIKEIKAYKSGDYLIDSIYFTSKKQDPYNQHVLYVIYESNIGYVFSGKFNDAQTGSAFKDIFDYIIRSFQINRMTINASQEHYVEFMPFFNHNFTLKSPIFSNMTLENQFVLEGTLKENSDLKGLNISVEKNSQRLDTYIPISEGSFKGTVYIPFGTGKHNITIALDGKANAKPNPSEPPATPKEPLLDDLFKVLNATIDEAIKPSFSTESENVCLKFSVINVSSTAIKDTLPSKYINYDQPDVYATANLLTYNLSSEYAKAKAIYEWLYDHYDINASVEGKGLRPLEVLVKENKANALELSVLQVGLMRALDIPSRIVRGNNEMMGAFWVETYLNGKWLITDIANEILDRPLIPSEVKYFNLNRKTHYEQFITTEILPF